MATSPCPHPSQNCNVSSFEGSELASGTPRVQELDLRANLISSVTDVVPVGLQLPALKLLNLSENRFTPFTAATPSAFAGAFTNLRVLVVNDTLLQWWQLQALEPHLPALEELHACKNKWQAITAAPDAGETRCAVCRDCPLFAVLAVWRSVATSPVAP